MTEAVKVIVDPISTEAADFEIETDVGFTPLTVTVHLAIFPFVEAAVIVAVPFAFAVTFPPDTVATDVLEVVQVIVESALVGATLAVSDTVSPFQSSALVLFSVTEVTAGLETVTLQVALLLFEVVAVMVVLPAATAVILPPETVATEGLEDFQVTVWSASAGRTDAVIVLVFPITRFADVLDRVTLVAEGGVTVTEHVTVFPLTLLAVIVALPFPTAVTFPPDTVAILASEEDHVTL